MIKIAPSILAADFTRLGDEIRSVSNADMIHFDVMDGSFVPDITYGIPVLQAVRRVTDLELDVHLMTHFPARLIESFAEAGADMISVHVESDHPRRIAEALREMEQYGVKKAVALRPNTATRAIEPYIEQLDMVLVMTVEPGYGGQPLLEYQLQTVRRVRSLLDRLNPDCDLEVDGGVRIDNARRIKDAGANVLVAGSAIFGGTDRAAAVETLRTI